MSKDPLGRPITWPEVEWGKPKESDKQEFIITVEGDKWTVEEKKNDKSKES